MSDIYFVSDTHFGHANTFLKFKNPDGTPMRPFTSVEEMDEVMIARWNSTVKPGDKVYHLGDVAFGPKGHMVKIMKRLAGHKRLVLGNHDRDAAKDYLEVFDDLYSSRLLDHILFTHIPVHPDSISGKTMANVHGHLHSNSHRMPNELPCPPYLNICVELTDYRPLSFDEVKAKLKGRG
jgi:calcineurin-like phosphoesterase family protein